MMKKYLILVIFLGISKCVYLKPSGFVKNNLPTVEDYSLYPDSLLRNLKYQYKSLHHSKTAFSEHLATATRDLEKVQEELSKVDEKSLHQTEKDIDKEIVDSKDTLRVLEKEVKSVKDKLAGLKDKKKTTSDRIENMKKKQSKLAELKVALEDKVSHKKNYINTAYALHEDIENEIINEEKKFMLVDDIELLNNWDTSEDKYEEPGYKLTYDGIVFLQGIVQDGEFAYETGSIFELVPYCDPLDWPVMLTLAENRAARVDILNSGEVTAVTPSDASWISLDGLNFPSKHTKRTPLDVDFGNVHSVWKKSDKHGDPAYTRTRHGIVHLSGVLKVKENRPLEENRGHGVLIADLPEEARPSKWSVLAGMAVNKLARIDVESSGGLIVVFPLRQADWFSLDGISYLTAEAKVTKVQLKNEWKAYNERHPEPGYHKTEEGVVYLTGIVKNGVIGYEKGVIFTLPENCRPENWRVFKTIGDNELFRIDVLRNGDVVATAPHGSSSSWISLDGISFVTKHNEIIFKKISQ